MMKRISLWPLSVWMWQLVLSPTSSLFTHTASSCWSESLDHQGQLWLMTQWKIGLIQTLNICATLTICSQDSFSYSTNTTINLSLIVVVWLGHFVCIVLFSVLVLIFVFGCGSKTLQKLHFSNPQVLQWRKIHSSPVKRRLRPQKMWPQIPKYQTARCTNILQFVTCNCRMMFPQCHANQLSSSHCVKNVHCVKTRMLFLQQLESVTLHCSPTVASVFCSSAQLCSLQK